jgi:hypothetical protein
LLWPSLQFSQQKILYSPFSSQVFCNLASNSLLSVRIFTKWAA